MSLLEKYSDQIDAYVQNRMTDSEITEFESVLNQHRELQKEVDVLNSMFNSYENKDVVELKKRLDAFEKQKLNVGEKTKIRTLNPRWYWAAAMLIGLALGVTYFSWNDSDVLPYENEMMAGLDKNFARDQIGQVNTGKRNLKRKELNKSEILFIDLMGRSEKLNSRSKDLDDFIEHGRLLLNKQEYIKQFDGPSRIILAKAYLLNGEDGKAIRCLDPIKKTDKLYCHALYYKVLSYVINENNQELETLLTTGNCEEYKEELNSLKHN